MYKTIKIIPRKFFSGIKHFSRLQLNKLNTFKIVQSTASEEDLLTQGGGERQAAPNLNGIRSDHIARYKLATRFIPNKAVILDMACGAGYGSYLLATKTKCRRILAVDLSKDAIEYARRYYNSLKIEHRQEDCLMTSLDPEGFDVAVCFETLEHIKEGRKLLIRFFKTIKPGGRLILSSPNQLRMPFNPKRFPFHVRHYTAKELANLIKSVGFSVEKIYSQNVILSKSICSGPEGLFLIFVCKKPFFAES